jgi:hypothetical protein
MHVDEPENSMAEVTSHQHAIDQAHKDINQIRSTSVQME